MKKTRGMFTQNLRYFCLVGVIALGLMTIVGTGGGGGGGSKTAYEPASSESFSPVLAQDEEGNPTKLYWKYQVNQGKPLVLEEMGEEIIFNFGKLVLTIDPNDLQRTAKFSGDISGYASGIFKSGVSENITLDGATTFFNDEIFDVYIDLYAEGERAEITFRLSTEFDDPIEWFLDRNDLDELWIGYIYNESVSSISEASWSWNTDGDQDSDHESAYGTVENKWKIVGIEDSMIVQGKEYSDIVKVERETVIPSYYDSSGSEECTITYWVAKGVGIIKSFGEFTFLDEPLTLELIETNLQ